MSNRNYLVEAGGERFFARIALNNPAVQVDRAAEAALTRAAGDLRISPPVVHVGPGVLVTRFLDNATPVTAAEFARDGRLDQVIALMRRCHDELARHVASPQSRFDVFEAIRGYMATLSSHGCRREADLPRWIAASKALESAMPRRAPVMGHNDLLLANILSDGRRLWLVDWEYGGLNTPYFDISSLICNAELDDAARDELLAAYFGDNPARHHGALAIMRCAMLLREFCWSLVAERHSSIAFDYVNYSERYIAMFDSAVAELDAVA